jgi:P pilus assembly chaperone PapD
MVSILHVVKEQFRNVKLIKLMLMLCMGLCFVFSTKVCAEETASVKIVTTQPKVGSNIEVQVENVSDDTDLSYQWYVDDDYTGKGYNIYMPSEDD